MSVSPEPLHVAIRQQFVKIAGIAPVGGTIAVIDGYLKFIVPAAGVCLYLFRQTRQGKTGGCITGNVNTLLNIFVFTCFPGQFKGVLDDIDFVVVEINVLIHFVIDR